VTRTVLFLLLSFAVDFTRAETEPDPEPSPPVDPKVLLQISVTAKNNEFRIGEKIPVTLAFNTRVKNRYELDEANYDRSGRLPSEHFTVTPGDGAEDPLADYFAPDTVHIGGGLRGFRILSQKRWTIVLNLNEWVRFTKPGEYKLTVSSDRVEILDSSQRNGKARVTAVSNSITLKIVARDLAWERQALNDAIAKLNAPGPLKRATTQGSYEVSRLEAAETLRFLGTAEAVRELVRQMGVENSGIASTCFFGIISSPERAVARKALAEALAAPDYPITDDFVDGLEWVEGRESVGGFRSKDGGRETLAKVVQALPNKRGPAARVTLYTIVNDFWVRRDDRRLPPETKRELIRQLVSIFHQLPIEQQASLLQDRWEDIKDPDFRPLLKQLVEFDVKTAPPGKYGWVQDLPAVALRRWFEVDPARARPPVIAEISRQPPRIAGRNLTFLPDETLPEVEQALADHFTAAQDYSISSTLAALIERYATRAVLPQVVRKLGQTKADDPACEIVTPILAYILRVDPAGALPYIEKSIAERRKKGGSVHPQLDAGSKRKLIQFAPGTRFTLFLSMGQPESIADVRAFLESHGMSLEEEKRSE
jgi:hypothetical protein